MPAALSTDSANTGGLPANPYVLQAQEFYEALANNLEPRVTAEDGREALRIALAAVESATTGSEVLATDRLYKRKTINRHACEGRHPAVQKPAFPPAPGWPRTYWILP